MRVGRLAYLMNGRRRIITGQQVGRLPKSPVFGSGSKARARHATADVLAIAWRFGANADTLDPPGA